MKSCVVAVVAAIGMMGGCASSGSSGPDGPTRAMARLSEPVRAAAAGYVESIEGVSRELAGVTDTASAKAAMPRIEALLGPLAEHWRTLEAAGPSPRAEARYAFWRRLTAADELFDSQVGRIKGTPGVGSALGGLLDKVPRWR